MSATLRSPDPARECSSMFLTIEFGSLAVLHHLVEIASKQLHQLRRLLHVLRHRADRSFQLVDELDRERGEIVDEVQRVLDFMGNAGSQLTERGKLFGLDQALLRGFQLIKRLCKLPGTGLDILKKTRILNSYH